MGRVIVEGRRRRLGWLLASSALVAGPSVVLAQEGMVAGDALLEPVTVTATSNPVEAFEFPGQVSVMGTAELQTLQPSTVNDILRYVPGVQMMGGPRTTGEVPAIRGFSGPDVTILFDGVRQNYNSGHDGRLFIDPALIGRAEVVRGPTSALYGSGGLGGTIEFRTLDAVDLLDPGKTMGVRVGGGYNSVDGDNHYSTTAFASRANVDVVGSVAYRDAGDIQTGDNSSIDNNERITSSLVKGSYTGIENHKLELSYLGFRGDVTEPNDSQGNGSGGKVDKDIANDTLRAGWRWRDPDRSWLDLGLVGYYVRNKVSEKTIDDLGASPKGTRLDREVTTLGFRLDNRSRIEHGAKAGSLLTYGIETFRDEQDGASSASADGERGGVPDATALTTAVFVQNEISLVEPFGTPGVWYIVPGLRYDHFRNDSDDEGSASDGAFSPKLGLSYLPTEWLLLFGSVAHAFRAPTFDELYANGRHFSIPGFANNYFIANTDLKPQKTWNYELGAGLQFQDVVTAGDKLELKGSHFWIKGEDFIDLEVDQPYPPECFPPNCDGTTQSVNVADAKLHGWDISGSYETSRIVGRVGFTTLDGRDEDTGRPLGVLQPNTLLTQLAFKLHEIDALAGWRGTFANRLDKADPGEERDAYMVHDLFVSWQPKQPLLHGLRIDAGIANIFDKTYSEVYTDAAEEGRDYRFGISYTLQW